MARLVLSGQFGGGRRGPAPAPGGTITLPAGTRPPRGYNPDPVGAEWTPAGSTRTYTRSLRGT